MRQVSAHLGDKLTTYQHPQLSIAIRYITCDTGLCLEIFLKG